MNVTVHAAETSRETLLYEHLPHLPHLLRAAGDVSGEWALWRRGRTPSTGPPTGTSLPAAADRSSGSRPLVAGSSADPVVRATT